VPARSRPGTIAEQIAHCISITGSFEKLNIRKNDGFNFTVVNHFGDKHSLLLPKYVDYQFESYVKLDQEQQEAEEAFWELVSTHFLRMLGKPFVGSGGVGAEGC
jgi:hypothetical protein